MKDESDIIEADHWSKVPLQNWCWPNFSPAELASKGDGSFKISRRALNKLQRLRTMLGVPLIITSAYRDPIHNKNVGGAKRSQHLLGRAFDIRVDNVNPTELIAYAQMAGFTGFGTYPDQGFIHIDDRDGTSTHWGKAFPERDTRFSSEPVAKPGTQATREGAVVAVTLTALEGVVTDAQPLLPATWISGAFVTLGLVSLGVVLWRAYGRKEREE